MILRPSLPPLRLITVFDAVLRAGSLQRAAAELNVSQPAVSQAIKSLEDHIGARLLDRDTRPASLTEAGTILQGGVSRGLAEIGGALEEIRAIQDAAENSLTVACTVGTATYWLMPRLTEFHENHPDIAVSVHTVASGVPRVTPGVDVAIRYGLGDWNDGPVRRMLRERVVPVCSPDLFTSLAPRGFDLEHAPLIHVDSGQFDWMGWQDYLQRIGRRKPAGPGRVYTNYVQATQAAVAGQGVMLGWKSMTGELVKDGKLVELPLPAVVPDEAFFLVFAERRKPTGSLDILVEWLLATANRIAADAPPSTSPGF
jgi:LysR family transcriptional regulator, glycine cleavage system transcriptional activator